MFLISRLSAQSPVFRKFRSILDGYCAEDHSGIFNSESKINEFEIQDNGMFGI